MQLGIITSLIRSINLESSKTTFQNSLAQLLLVVQCNEEANLDSHVHNDLKQWFNDTFKAFFESRCNGVATVEDTNKLIRDLAVATAYYRAKSNESIISSIGDVELAKTEVLTQVITAIENTLKAILTDPAFQVKRTLASETGVEKLENYKWPGDETLVAHAWYYDKAVATAAETPINDSSVVPKNPPPAEKSWLDKHFKKIALAGMVVNLLKK